MIVKNQGAAQDKDLTFYVKYHILTGHEDEFRQRLLALVHEMSKEETFVSSYVHQEGGDPTRFTMYERWRDTSREAFMNYQMEGRLYRKEYEERLPQISATPRKIHILKTLKIWTHKSELASLHDLAYYVNFHLKETSVESWMKCATAVFDELSQRDAFVCAYIHQDAEDPSRFTIYERWREWGRQEMVSDHLRAQEFHKFYESMLPGGVQALRSIRLLQPID